MSKKLTPNEKDWYFDAIEALAGSAVSCDRVKDTVTYNKLITSDESHVKSADAEELAHAVMIGMLHSKEYKYQLQSLGHEIHLAHGSKGSKSDEVDIVIRDNDGLPYAMIELKAANSFDSEKYDAIKNQLFGTAHLLGGPRLLIYATIEPKGIKPKIRSICIDYTRHKSFESWQDEGEPHSLLMPVDYMDIDYQPLINGGKNDLSLDSTQADFRAVALTFHNEFFGEHADNTIFVNLVKCLLAKIHDERTSKIDDPYKFQVFVRNGKPDSAATVFKHVNELYTAAYKRYIDPLATEIDEINPKEFSEERVKTVVQSLQGLSITKGASRHGDVIGAFFEQILRAGFKQDRGMYFTHDNVVRFMIEAVDLAGLTKETWAKSNHPENRLPYVMDPACGSGTFLLHAMSMITSTVKVSEKTLVVDHDAQQFYNARLSDQQPNYWAESFLYGFDPKFIMAITAKVNMVLHGDGSAHVFKDDAFRPFSRYTDVRLRPCSDTQRSVSRSQYKPDMCESFDLIASNPPFGITLSPETRAKLSTTFSLPESTPSEGLFIERCFQLLKPRGRLAIVVPESVLNAKEMISVRLFLYRFFNIRGIVTLPRNIFIDTPTLTSLVFAQKKTSQQIDAWDDAWGTATAEVETRIKLASKALSKSFTSANNAAKVAATFMNEIKPIITDSDWISKGGKSPAVLKTKPDPAWITGEEAAMHYREILKTAGFENLRTSFIFSRVSSLLDYEYPAYIVEEIAYKLSKRKERARPNQLCLFEGRISKAKITNLHLAEEECNVMIEKIEPKTVLSMMRENVKWET